MIERAMFLRQGSTRALLGLAVVSSLAVAGCGAVASGNTSTNTSLTACTAAIADLTEGTGGQATAPNAHVSGTLQIDGSTALAPLFTRVGAEFDTGNGNATHTAVTGNGSGKGLSDVNSGAVAIGLSDIFQADKGYSGLTDHQVAVVAFTLVVNNDLKGKVDNLTTAQIKQIYTGQVTNWSQIGGPNELITVVNRPTNSGTRATFEKYVLGSADEVPGNTLQQDSTGAVFQAVTSTPGAIGYVSTGFVTTSQASNAPAPICIDGAKADATDIASGKYTFWNIEHAYTKGPATGAAKALLEYVESDAVQNNDLVALNYYKLSTIAHSAITSHLEAGAPTPESFYPQG